MLAPQKCFAHKSSQLQPILPPNFWIRQCVCVWWKYEATNLWWLVDFWRRMTTRESSRNCQGDEGFISSHIKSSSVLFNRDLGSPWKSRIGFQWLWTTLIWTKQLWIRNFNYSFELSLGWFQWSWTIVNQPKAFIFKEYTSTIQVMKFALLLLSTYAWEYWCNYLIRWCRCWDRSELETTSSSSMSVMVGGMYFFSRGRGAMGARVFA